MNEMELLPCPFCGGPASVFAALWFGWYAQCRCCGAKQGRWQNEEIEAAQIWNRRVNPKPLNEQKENQP